MPRFTRPTERPVHGAHVRARANVNGQHIDFMIGSAGLEVDGVTADGERAAALRALTWEM